MKSITIHNIETPLANQIELLAKKEKISQNKLIKKLLSKALGIEATSKNANLLKYAKSMSEDEAESIMDEMKCFSEIDHSEW